jgi:AbiTii
VWARLEKLSVEDEALRIVRETRDKLLNDSVKTSSALKACATICKLLRVESEYDWIGLELNGYYEKYQTFSKLEKALPEYRKARCMYVDAFNRPIRVSEAFSKLEDFPLGQSVAELEECTKNGLHIIAGQTITFIVQRFKVPVHEAFVSQLAVHKVLSTVNNRVLDFLNDIILELEYFELRIDIFEEARKAVDKALMTISRPALEKLVTTYKKLPAAKTGLECSQVALACRKILEDFTDAIFKPEYLPRGQEAPTHEQTKNKLAYTFTHKLGNEKGRDVRLMLAQVDYLERYFDRLTDYIQKQVHAKGFEPSGQDAKRCVIYTYLMIWDVFQLLGIP